MIIIFVELRKKDWGNIPNLEKKLDEINEKTDINPNFRIIISTSPNDKYPISFLQKCEKVTFSTTRSDPVGVEPDVRDSIMRSYSEYWNQLTRIALPYLPFIRFVF